MNSEIGTSLQECLTWAKSNGAFIDERVAFEVSEKFGIRAIIKEKIGSNSNSAPLISIPKQLLITQAQAREEFGLSEEGSLPTSNPNAITQLYLSKLRFHQAFYKESKFQPYLKMLPLTLNQPYFWNKKILDLLQGTDILIIIKRNLVNFLNEWIELLSKVNETSEEDLTALCEDSDKILEYIEEQKQKLISGNVKWNSFMAYIWSSCIFTSRAFPEIVITEKCKKLDQAFLYPIVDFLNHQNDSKVRWTFKEDNVNFISKEVSGLNKGDELFNNYGDKTNEELLLGYGFIQETNKHDSSRLTLRLDPQVIIQSQKYGVGLQKGKHIVGDDSLQFEITPNDILPDVLLEFFAFLNKLDYEEFLTVRSILDGSTQLYSILQSKIDFFKTQSKIDTSLLGLHNDPTVVSMIKLYMTSQRKLFTQSLEHLQKLQKQQLKALNSQNSISFKTIFKSDKQFANSLLFAFGVTKYEDLISKNCIKEALLLWLVRNSNKTSLTKKLEYEVPSFIDEMFEHVNNSIVIEKDDVLEYMDFYKKLFPNLKNRIPEVFAKGNWSIKQFIIADNVYDNLVWVRPANQEPLILSKIRYNP